MHLRRKLLSYIFTYDYLFDYLLDYLFPHIRKTPEKSGVFFSLLMPAMGLEPIRCCHQQILSLPRLPFRHAGISNTNRIILKEFLFVNKILNFLFYFLSHSLYASGLILPCLAKSKPRFASLYHASNSSRVIFTAFLRGFVIRA